MAEEENSVHVQIRDINALRINQIAPTQVAVVVDEAAAAPVSQNRSNPKNPTFTSTIFKILFFAHLMIVAVHTPSSQSASSFPKTPNSVPSTTCSLSSPLLSSIALSALVSFLWLPFTLHYPEKTLDSSLELSPLLTCLFGTLLLIYGTRTSFPFGAPGVVFGISQSMYACWINHRVEYAQQILSVSMPTAIFCVAAGNYVVVALVAAVGYSWVWILGVGGIAAAKDRRFDAVYVLLLLLSLAWTMQVATWAWLIAKSCTRTGGGLYVGTRGNGFGEASEETWEMFRSRGMCQLIDLDVTSSFCFFCGCAGGALTGLGCGSWMLAVDEGYAAGPTVYAFIIGYFIVRIGMALPQACVSAYHVVYAEDPENGLLGSTIADQIRELNIPD